MLDFAESDRAARLVAHLSARYAFLGLLGRGGAGLVFEVENRQLGRREALKFLQQSLGREAATRFANEAKVMASLDHPHIVPIYAFGDDEGCLWYAMKRVEGPTLGGYLKAHRHPGPLEVLQVAIPVLEALALSHGRGIVHRDIKPANILLDPQAGPLLTDFGVAKVDDDPLLTETGIMLGTPAYVSPEQSLGKTVDGRTDLYALGVSLYQMLTGRLPFSEGNSLAVLLKRFQEEAPPLAELRPDLPAALLDLITRAMERDPARRFASAVEMREACVAVAAAAGLAWDKPLALPPGLGPRREPMPAALVPLLAGTGWALWRLRPVPPAPAAPPPRHAEAPRQDRVPFPAAPSPATAPASLSPRPSVERPKAVETSFRRAVSPPQILEPPRVLLPEGSSCLGQAAIVELQVDEKGTVTHVRILSKIHPECADLILKATRAFRFNPALAADGLPVASTLALSIEPGSSP